MTLLSDMAVYNIIITISMFSYVIFIFLPDINVIVIYMANCLFVGGLGGMQNLGFLISELRVPPNSLGSVNMFSFSAAVGFGFITPFVSQLPSPYPLVACGLFAIFAYLASFALPTTGAFLKIKELNSNCKSEDTSPHKSNTAEAVLSNHALHSMSFEETFMDRKLNASRNGLS